LDAAAVPVKVGLAIVGDDESTGPPAPVAVPARPAATPAPKPVMPAIGRPVPFVSVTDDGVPSAGATSVGELESTSEPVPVELVAPLPPLETDRGFCRVIELNVGEGYVWASAIAGTIRAVRRSFFMGLISGDGHYAVVVPNNTFRCGGLSGQVCSPSCAENGVELREWHRAKCNLPVLNLLYRHGFITRDRLRKAVYFTHNYQFPTANQ
jgi:hypothetical protein